VSLLSRAPEKHLKERQYEATIAALEDKTLQRAVVEVLSAFYEEDFPGFAYGFRPERGPHGALDAVAAGICKRTVNSVLDADIRDFFSSLDRVWLSKFLEHRIADRVNRGEPQKGPAVRGTPRSGRSGGFQPD